MDAVTAPAASVATKTGYSIASWNTAKGGNGSTVSCGASVAGANLGVTADGQSVTLYAQWMANTYAVTLSAAGAENAPTTYVSATYAAAMPAITVPTRTGYTFGGYYTGENGGGTQYYDAAGASVRAWDRTTATTLYAKWTVNTYTVTFTVQGNGSVSPSGSGTYAYGTVLSVSATPATGYVFEKWSDGETAATRTVTVTGAATYTAIMRGAYYSINFNGNNATGGSTASQAFTYDVWQNLNANGYYKNVTVTFDSSIPTIITVEAQQTASASLSFNGWSWTADGPVSYADKEYVRNLITTDHGGGTLFASWGSGSVTLYAPTIRPTGWTFLGWCTQDTWTYAGTEGETYSVSADVTLIANWTEHSYTIRFNSNGGTGTMSDITTKYTWGIFLTKNSFTRTGYTFAGWATSATGPKVYGDQAAVSSLSSVEGSVVTLYAVWTANSYAVEFDGNGATGGTMESQTFTYDESQALQRNAFTKFGQTFLNWRTTDGREFADGETVKNLATSGTITLSAVWSSNHFVAFDGNGATNTTMAVQTFTKDEEQALTLNAYEKAGYTFGGWATNEATAAALLPRYSDGETVSIDAPEGATNTLYAVWTTNRYSIIFHPVAADVTGTMETLSDCAYDTAITLPECAYANSASFGFLGWAQMEGGDVAFADGAVVSNLTATANGTVDLYAVWDGVGELSKAVGLTNAVLRDTTQYTGFSWSVLTTFGRTDGSCATSTPPSAGNQYTTMEMSVVGPGTFSFYWCCGDETGDENSYKLWIDGVAVSVTQPTKKSVGWALVKYALAAGTHTIAWANGKTHVSAERVSLYVDDVTWSPKSQTEEEFSYDDGSGVAHTVSVPHSWVDQYFTAAEIEELGGYKSLLEGSANKSGWAVSRWQEYVAGTDPTDAESVFRVTAIEVTDDGVNLTWSPDLREADPARVYTVFGKESLDDAAWKAVDYSTHRFFRVEVDLK